MHTYVLHWNTTDNTIYKVCLRYTHSNMKQFLSLFKFKRFKPLNKQYLVFLCSRRVVQILTLTQCSKLYNMPKHCHNHCLKSYPKQFAKQLEVYNLAFLEAIVFKVHFHIIVRITHSIRENFNSMTLDWANGLDNDRKFESPW